MANRATVDQLKVTARELGYAPVEELQSGKFGIVLLVTTPQGEVAVMKQAAVRTCNFQIVHEAHVLSILDREHKEHGGEGRQHMTQLINFHHPSTGAVMVMNHCGDDLGDWQIVQVSQLRANRSSPASYITNSRKVCRDLFSAIDFLSSVGHMCHHDIKFANVAVKDCAGSDSLPHATLIDFGTCYPCLAIPDSVYGTHNYHPREVHIDSNYQEMDREQLSFVDNFVDPLNDMYGGETGEIRARAELRYDEPRGSCDTFGVGVVLTEMLYGVSEKSLDGFRQWENLLFPTSLSPASDKEAVVASLDMHSHGEEDAACHLKDIMMDRCLEKDLFYPIILYALEDLGCSALLLRVLSSSARTRLSAQQAFQHSFFTAPVTNPPEAPFVTPPSHAIRQRQEQEFDEYCLSSTPFQADFGSFSSTPPPSLNPVNTNNRQQRLSGQLFGTSDRISIRRQTQRHSADEATMRQSRSADAAPPMRLSAEIPMRSSFGNTTPRSNTTQLSRSSGSDWMTSRSSFDASPSPYRAASSWDNAAPMSPMSPLPSSNPKGTPDIKELRCRIKTLKECNQRKSTPLRISIIKKLEMGVEKLNLGEEWQESEEEDDY